jgi:hypothetical protein
MAANLHENFLTTNFPARPPSFRLTITSFGGEAVIPEKNPIFASVFE